MDEEKDMNFLSDEAGDVVKKLLKEKVDGV